MEKLFKRKNNNESAITLIALVITIIVLLILAGISISMLTGENGLLTKAGVAKDENIIGEEKEQVKLAYVSVMTKKLENSVDEENLQAELNNSMGTGKTSVSTNGDNSLNVYFRDTNHNYNISGGVVTKIEDEEVPEGKVAKIRSTYYETLQAAFDAVPNNNTQTEVVLLSNISENVSIETNKNIILNLNNKKITNFDRTLEVEDLGEIVEYKQPVLEIKTNGVLE